MDKESLKAELKRLIIHETQKDLDPATLGDTEPLFGDGTRLGLDSIDGLQISVAVMQKYGKRIQAGGEARRVLKNVQSLADHIAE
jgi:acyl carrier protein